MANQIPPPKIHHWQELPWDDPLSSLSADQKANVALMEKARASGTKRKKIVRGEAGFFMNRSTLPGGFRVPPHSHNHDELMVVLKGGCLFDDGIGQLAADDSIVIRAGFKYGFTCGEQGMEFLTIRTDDASIELAE